MVQKIYLAGGWFWGVQAALDLMTGIEKTFTGYCAGHLDNPTYEEVCSKTSGHTEAVSVEYDPEIISINAILDLFFSIHNPYQSNGQGNDIGPQYRSGIYWDRGNEIVHEQIKDYFLNKDDLKNEMTTEILPIRSFWNAEDYHQDYLGKNPSGYCHVNINQVKNYLLVKGLLKK